MTRTAIATALNFFLPGAGYLALGIKTGRALAFLAGVLVLTYVEFAVKTAAPHLYLPMFAAVLVMNSGFAIDAWKEGKRLCAGQEQVAASAA